MDENVQSALNGQPEQAPQPQQQQSPVKDALVQWISGAYAIAGLGPQPIRDAITRAQNNYTGMVQSTLAKKIPDAQKARWEWEQNTAVATDINRRRLDEYGAAWMGKAPIEEKMARVAEVAGRWGDQQIAYLANSPEHFPTFGQLYDQLTKQQETFEHSTQSLDTQIKGIEKQLGLHDSFGGELPPIAPYVEGEHR